MYKLAFLLQVIGKGTTFKSPDKSFLLTSKDLILGGYFHTDSKSI